MRIGIDGTGFAELDEGAPSGIINYALAVTNHLLEIDGENEYIIYCRNRVPHDLLRLSPQSSTRILRSDNRKILQLFGLPRASAEDGVELLFFPFNSASLFCPCRSVVTIHDLHPFVVQEQFDRAHSAEVHGGGIKSRINRHYWRLMLRLAARKDRVIVPSEATKRDMVNVFGTKPDKIDVVYEGVDIEQFRFSGSDEDLARFRSGYGLSDPFILCVGSHAYKNLPGAIRAFSRARKKMEKRLLLAITGNKAAVTSDIRTAIRKEGLEDEVIFTDFVPDGEMKLFYRAAEMLLFPSFYEGFGLPVLEAFASGTPVVASNAGALPEVAGDAAILADPEDLDGLARAILCFMTDDQKRAEKVRLGLARADQFSWTETATGTLAVFRRLEEAHAHRS